jgi:hypothetical protein
MQAMTGLRSVLVLVFVLLFTGSLTCATACPHIETTVEKDCPIHGVPDCCNHDNSDSDRTDCVDTHFTAGAKQADVTLDTILVPITKIAPPAPFVWFKDDLSRRLDRLPVPLDAYVLRI